MKFLFLCFAIMLSCVANLPDEFIYLKEFAPQIQQSVRYFTKENFVGKQINGYNSKNIILTKKAAIALTKVNEQLNKQGYELVIYDGYRPQMAVDEFVLWGKNINATEGKEKQFYYPDLTRKEIFEKGFVASKSSHSRGSTVDLTIIEKGKKVCEIKEEKRNGKIFLNDCTLDMGMHFDFFGSESHAQSDIMPLIYNQRRMILIKAMENEGFKVAQGEWWHFTLINEPFKNEYFNFKI